HPLLGAVVFPYGQAFHLTHHLFAMVPHHRIARAHAILTRHPPYREGVIVCQGFFFRRPGTVGPSLLDLLSRPPGELRTRGTGPSRGSHIARPPARSREKGTSNFM